MSQAGCTSCLRVTFEQPGSNLVVKINEPEDSELIARLKKAFEDFVVSLKRTGIQLRWDPNRLLEDDETVIVSSHTSKMKFKLAVAKTEIASVIEEIKERIIGVCTGCGLYNDVYVLG